MTEQRFIGLIETLEATFDAASSRADREAADDLARSLRHDRSVPQVLERDGWSVVANGSSALTPLVALGSDYALTKEDDLVPLGSLVAVRSDEPAPETLEDSFRERLRQWAREGANVLVHTGERHFLGRLLATGRDHVLLNTRYGEVLVGFDAIARVSRRPGSSTGAP